MSVKVGLVTGSPIPSPVATPCANTVLPAPKSPCSSSTSPGWSHSANRVPSRRVWSALWLITSRIAPSAFMGAKVIPPSCRQRHLAAALVHQPHAGRRLQLADGRDPPARGSHRLRCCRHHVGRGAEEELVVFAAAG